MDATQILLIIMITVLGATLTLIGIQLFFTLRELEKGLQKANVILEDTKRLSENLSQVSEKFKGLAADLPLKGGSVLLSLLSALGFLKTFFQKRSREKEGR